MLTPKERSLRAKLAAHELHARYDSREITAKARTSFLARFEADVDPEGKLPEAERRRRAEHARKAHFARMALKSAQARRGKARASGRMDQARASKRKEKPPTDEAASEAEV
jgi:hypothetical protein